VAELRVTGRILEGDDAAAALAEIHPKFQEIVKDSGQIPVEIYADEEVNPGHFIRYKGSNAEVLFQIGQNVGMHIMRGQRTIRFWAQPDDWETVKN
jgi:hypothetical protein